MLTICFYQDSRHDKALFWIRRILQVGYISKRNDGMTELRINGYEQIRKIIKDLLPYIERQETNIKLRDIMRKIVHIPSSKKINTLFHYFKNKKEHIAVVVNEYGNTLGIVTMEDVLEELVGEIQDESDDADENNIKKIDENTILVPGSTNIDDINELLHMSIDDHEGSFQTVAGMIMYYSGKIPKKGHVLKINSLTFTIIDSDHKKIEKVKIEKISSSFKKDLIHSTHKIFK